MARWFEEKFEREKLRNYTKKRLNRNPIENFSRKLSITNWIIITNIIIYILLIAFIQIFGSEKILNIFALQSNNFFSGKYWTVLTSMFMHVELWHLLANMVSLFFVGNFLERLIGRKRVFWLYIISGIFAGIFYSFLSYYLGVNEVGMRIFGSPEIFAVGASGAIFSLLGVLAVLTPYTKVYLIAGPIIALIFQALIDNAFKGLVFIQVFDMLIYFYIIFSIFALFSFSSKIMKITIPIKMPFWLLPIIAILPLVIIGLFVSLPIGNSAHFGGLLIGLLYGFYLKNKYKKRSAMISRVFSN